MNSFRVMAVDGWQKERLLVMGESPEDAVRRLPEALDDHTADELRAFEHVWVEAWTWDSSEGKYGWQVVNDISIRRIKLRAAAREQHQRGRSRWPRQQVAFAKV
jgi:hypothetical protein